MVPLHGAQAQRRVDVALDVAGSIVRYDGFLSSAAASVMPTLRVAGPRVLLDARASSLFFQSGRSSVSADVDASWLANPGAHAGMLRLDLSGGGSQYATNYRYSYLLAGARLLAERPTGPSAWLGGRVGSSWSSIPADPILGVGAVRSGHGALQASGGVAARGRQAVVRAELRGERVGAERLADAVLSGEWRARRLGVDALVGARRARIDDVRGFAEGGVTLQASERLRLSLHGGRYASDPVQGVVAGRYAELSARFALGGGPRRPAVREPFGAITRLGFEVLPLADGGRELRIRVPGAARVEIMADFTGWEPVELHAVGDERWALTTHIPAGVHRVNVRIDGGAWTVPPGLTAVADEFGGAVGLLVVE